MGIKRVYYYTSEEYGLDAIIDEKLKICTLDNANDIHEHSNIYSDEDETFNYSINTPLKSGLKYGYLCFSEQWDNCTMWGHYGGNHKGVCLGFDIDDSSLTKIKYIDNKINLNDYNPQVKNMSSIKIAGEEYKAWQLFGCREYKSSDWSYENEYRYIAPFNLSEWNIKQNIYFHKFRTKGYKEFKLKEIILGVRSDLSHNYIWDILRSRKECGPILLSKVKSNDKSYRLSRNSKGWLYGTGDVHYFDLSSLDDEGRINIIEDDITMLDERKLQLKNEIERLSRDVSKNVKQS